MGSGLYIEQGGRCAVSKESFNDERFPDALVQFPYAPSLDRIEWRKGYAAGNVRLVCVAVNFGMNQWGTETYLRLARGAVEEQDRTRRAATAAPVGDSGSAMEARPAAGRPDHPGASGPRL